MLYIDKYLIKKDSVFFLSVKSFCSLTELQIIMALLSELHINNPKNIITKYICIIEFPNFKKMILVDCVKYNRLYKN